MGDKASGDILALVGLAAGYDLGLGPGRPAVENAQANAAVVQQQVGADLERLEDLRVRQARAGGVAGLALPLEPETAAGLEPHRTAGDGSDPPIRPPQAGADPDRPPHPPPHARNHVA